MKEESRDWVRRGFSGGKGWNGDGGRTMFGLSVYLELEKAVVRLCVCLRCGWRGRLDSLKVPTWSSDEHHEVNNEIEDTDTDTESWYL